jgi:transposase
MRCLSAGRSRKIRSEEQILRWGRYDTPRTGPSGCGTSVVPVAAMRLKAGGQAGSGVREAAGRE